MPDKELLILTDEDIDKLILFCEDFDNAIVCRNLQGIVTSFNKGAEELYGYAKEEVIGKPLSSFTPRERQYEFDDILDKINRGIKVENYETVRKKKNGELITIIISVYPVIHDGKLIGSIGISRDAVEREVFKLAIQGGNFGIWDWEIRTNKVYYSNRWKEMLGYNNCEISDDYEEWVERIHKEDYDLVMDKINRHLQGEEFTVEYRLKCKEGNDIWVRTRGKVIKWDNEGNPLRMTGTNEDINQEMLLRIKTQENENRIIGIYNTISAGIALGEIILDSSDKPIDYKCLQMNNYLGKIIGVNPESFPNENTLRMLPDNGRDWISMFGEAAKYGKSFAFEDYYENTDKYYQVNIFSPNPMQFTLLVTDITENKRKEIDLIEKYEELQVVYEELSATEEELRTNYKELEKANEAKSQFLANMSHELRTPLNGILGCTQLLNHANLSEEQMENVNIIEKSSKHLLELINNILDISKIESGKVEINYKRFNFLELMNYLIKDLSLLSMSKDIEIMYYIDPLISEELIGDNLRLKQILNNLISNALKFTDHGHIYLKINQISKTKHETKLKFIVEDSGIGISEDFKLKIFDKFTQEESSYTKKYRGFGLGLAISKELVEMMGGNIGFKSEADKGSVFYFTLAFKNITDRYEMIDDTEIQ